MSDKPFSLSIKVIILDGGGRVLLLRRAASSRANAGKWDLPGGKLDPGESFEAALLREAREETGLAITLTGVAGAAEWELPERKVAYLILRGRVRDGSVRLSTEHDDYRWVTPEEAGGMEVAPQFKNLIENLKQKPESRR